MDQFEEARLRAQKRLERAARVTQKAAEAPLPEVVPEAVPEAPKEKPEKPVSNDAIITVWIQLPDQAYSVQFLKSAVYQNAIRSKLTKQAISNAVKDGLRPLLGNVSEV